MIKELRGAWALFLASAVVMAGHGLNTSHLGVRGSIEGLTSAELGYVFAAFALGFLASTRITPALLLRVGHVRVYAAYVAGGSVIALVYGAFVDPIIWGVLRFFGGLCMSGIFVVSESWLNGIITRRDRAKMLSLYVMTQLLGLVCGQGLLELAPAGGFSLFVLASALISLSSIPMLLTISPTPVYRGAPRLSLRSLFRISPLGAVGIAFIGVAFSVAYSLGPVFGVEAGLSIREIAIFVASIYVGGTLFQYPVGWLADRFDRRRVVMVMSGFAAIVTSTPLWLPLESSQFVILACLLGAGVSPMYALLVAHANDFVEPERMPSVSAGLMFLQGVGAMVGPALAGVAMEFFGPSGYFLVLCGSMLMILSFAVVRSLARPVPEGGDGAYAPLPPKATAMAAEFYGEAARRNGG